jgi:uncharacterized membrane protein YgdD (TMEM256/DUF423 family)
VSYNGAKKVFGPSLHSKRRTLISTILIVMAGLMGAAGVVLAAAGAHVTAGSGLDSAAYMLLFHGVAVLGGAALLEQGQLWRPMALVALAGLVLGASLFSCDIALRVFVGQRLFAMAAPAGGTILIAAWLTLAVAAMVALVRR